MKGRQKIILIVLGVIIVLGALSLVGMLAFRVGKSSQQSAFPSPSINLSPTLAISPSEVSPSFAYTLTQTPTLIPSFGPTISPTVLPTPTPSPISTPSPTPLTFRSVPPEVRLRQPSETKTLSATASLDGFRSSNNAGSNTLDIRAGRNNFLISRGFVSFSLTSLPSPITLEKATLKLYQAKVVGNPYTVGGNLLVDHLNYGLILDVADYNRSAFATNIGTLTNTATLGWKELEVTERVKSDLSSGRSNSQYRLHFATETVGGDITGDFAYFESEENYFGTGNLPQLVVVFRRS